MAYPEAIQWKLYRAKQHYDELTRELIDYFKNDPGELIEAPESTAENQILAYKLKEKVPARFGLIAGDFFKTFARHWTIWCGS